MSPLIVMAAVKWSIRCQIVCASPKMSPCRSAFYSTDASPRWLDTICVRAPGNLVIFLQCKKCADENHFVSERELCVNNRSDLGLIVEICKLGVMPCYVTICSSYIQGPNNTNSLQESYRNATNKRVQELSTSIRFLQRRSGLPFWTPFSFPNSGNNIAI